MKRLFLPMTELIYKVPKSFTSTFIRAQSILQGKEREINPAFFLVFFTFYFLFSHSFLTDYQMVVDAQVVVTVNTSGADVKEILYPLRHQITLPLNALNMLFEDCSVAFNNNTRLDCDR